VNLRSKTKRIAPLHAAAFNGHVKIIECLLSHNADPNVLNLNKDSPLRLAIFKEQEECLLLLLQAKADCNIQDKNGNNSLFRVAKSGHEGIFAAIVTHGNASINGTKEPGGVTALMMACSNKKPKIVKILIDSLQVDLDKGDSIGNTALTHACSASSPACCKLLLDAKADPYKRNRLGQWVRLLPLEAPIPLLFHSYSPNASHKSSQ
jgi:uncharacterized protein